MDSSSVVHHTRHISASIRVGSDFCSGFQLQNRRDWKYVKYCNDLFTLVLNYYIIVIYI